MADAPGSTPASRPGPARVPNNGRVLAAELFGTAILVIGGPGTAILAPEVGLLGISLAFGLSLLVMAYVIGPVSGCHINPAVTLGLLITRRISGAHAVFAVIGQLIGGIAGAAVVFGIANGRPEFERGQFAANLWSGPYGGLGAAIVVEVVLTALLVVVVLAASSPGGRIPHGLGGLVVGLTLALIHLISIPVDNTSVNPARSIATALFADPDTGALEQLWAFVVFPLIGAVVGVIIWLVIDDATVEDTMLAEIPGMTEARDALDRVGDEAVAAVEDAVD
ncbi:MAG: aquaporin [Acidimicrobiales bacterium]